VFRASPHERRISGRGEVREKKKTSRQRDRSWSLAVCGAAQEHERPVMHTDTEPPPFPKLGTDEQLHGGTLQFPSVATYLQTLFLYGLETVGCANRVGAPDRRAARIGQPPTTLLRLGVCGCLLMLYSNFLQGIG
jgi:hypothetical protein